MLCDTPSRESQSIAKGIGKNGQNGQTSAREAYLHTSRADFVRSKKENFTEKLIF